MKKTVSMILYFLLLLEISCVTGALKPERWEGFYDDRMRVLISEFFLPDENNPSDIPDEIIRQRVAQRASLLLASYININLPRENVSSESDALFNRLINETLKAPKTLSSECLENNHCTVLTEYDITSINNELERLKKN